MRSRPRSSLLAALAAAGLLAPRPSAAEPAPELAADDVALTALALALATAPAPEELPPARSGEPPRIELVATVRAARLVFDEVPRLRVAYGGTRRVAWRAERRNLPARVAPGVLYEDVEVKVSLTGRLEEVEALLQDARRAAQGIRATPGPGASAAEVAP